MVTTIAEVVLPLEGEAQVAIPSSKEAVMPGKLFIHDDDDDDNDQADGRFSGDDVTEVAVGSTEALLTALDRLVARHATFDRVLFQTHGYPGRIKLAQQNIWDITLTGRFGTRRYHTLFPQYTRIYFDGCNVAVGSEGDKFLEAAGNVFLRSAGGETFGWTSYGYGYPGCLLLSGATPSTSPAISRNFALAQADFDCRTRRLRLRRTTTTAEGIWVEG